MNQPKPQQASNELENYFLGKFPDRSDAEVALGYLEEAGFSKEILELNAFAVKEKFTIRETKAIEGARGGAFAGAGLGIIVGLTINVVIQTFPNQNIPIDIPVVVLILACSLVGAIAVGAVGGITGAKVPQTEGENTPFEYSLNISGMQEDYDNARQVLLKHGILLKR
ncbi:MAG: hypothetical protein ACRC2R_25590 [Xenococcaceae cyanobacterium]